MRAIFISLCLWLGIAVPAQAVNPKEFHGIFCIAFDGGSAALSVDSVRIIAKNIPYPSLLEVVFVSPVKTSSLANMSASKGASLSKARLDSIRKYLASTGSEAKRVREEVPVSIQKAQLLCGNKNLSNPSTFIQFNGWCSPLQEYREACDD